MMSWRCPASLDIYRPNGTPFIHRRLPVKIRSPLHAVETSTGNYVISHAWENSWTWTVSEVTADGSLVRSFLPSHHSLYFNWPRHLSIDSRDRIFVADCENDRICVVYDQLSSGEVLLSRIIRPERLHFDEDEGQLLIACFEGKLSVCDLARPIVSFRSVVAL